MADLNQRRARKPKQLGGFDRFRSAILADGGQSLVKQEPCAWPFRVLDMADVSLTLIPDGELVTARYAGPVNASFLLMGHAWAQASVRTFARAVVLDFTQASIHFKGSDLDAALNCLSAEHRTLPRALLVQPRHAGMFKEFAQRIAVSQGILQRGFFDRAQAEAWVLEAAARPYD
ncbi:hypothetical protein [Pseudaquabacterium pictum]|uniref:Uncharacterized protein n=1 Tax=Pseudaquabacterium pictum TaxID=2315236 RepID=A0A480AVJ9_9BURK|nr:hypothetical protein [Rubrivivax pictus]GCL64940.1 hypothetical protein AQPW35_40210 [Rubrivivax pictus]